MPDIKKYDDGGPQFFECRPPCRNDFVWHRCRGRHSCWVPGCVEGTRNKGERTHPWDKQFWCGRCGGYIKYDPDIDSFYEGPWK